MKIFVVGGKSGSGKGEVAKMIEEYYIYKLKKAVASFPGCRRGGRPVYSHWAQCGGR